MIDISCPCDLSLDEFLAARDKCTAESDQALADKIKCMVAKYSCFDADAATFASRHACFKTFVPKRSPHMQPMPRPNHVKSSERELQGILNKLTHSNYAALSPKLLRLCMKETVTKIVLCILQKCYIHGSFSPLYHKLLKEFYAKYRSECHAAITESLNQLTDTLSEELHTLKNEPPTKEYDAYCIHIKKKDMLLAKIGQFIIIDQEYNHSQQTYQLYNIIESELHETVLSGDPCLYGYIDFLTLLYGKFYKFMRIPKSDSKKTLNLLHFNFPTLPKKIQFLWEDILQNS